ncbi:hypothetical protein DPMN_137085, partial [Dreissena polymorpha]
MEPRSGENACGYVVVRFISDYPGMWFLHCHIDLHNTNGMGMVIDEGDSKPTSPIDFPVCRNFEFKDDLRIIKLGGIVNQQQEMLKDQSLTIYELRNQLNIQTAKLNEQE